MKVYLISVDARCNWDGDYSEIKHVSSSYRKASQWLLDNGFAVYPFKEFRKKEIMLGFCENTAQSIKNSAYIIEKDVDID